MAVQGIQGGASSSEIILSLLEKSLAAQTDLSKKAIQVQKLMELDAGKMAGLGSLLDVYA